MIPLAGLPPVPGAIMSHEWIFEVLRDLKAYALANGLPALAAKAEEALRTAEAEIGGLSRGNGNGGAASGRPH